MPEIILEMPRDVSGRILESLEEARRSAPPDLRLTTYWKSYLAKTGIRVDSDRVTLRGESGFYYPGASYSGLDLLNTLLKLPWQRRYLATGTALDHGLPGGLGYALGGRRLNYDYLRAKFHLWSILRSGEGLPPRPTLLEIGSGTGILAAAAHRTFPGATYILVDLPDILSFASFFLAKAFPDKVCRFYHEWKAEGMGGADFVFVPSFEMGAVPDASVDLAFNTDSMQEMNLETIGGYFRELRRVLRGPRLFYQSNRRRKVMDGVAIGPDRFPYASGDVHLFMRQNDFMRAQWVKRKAFRVLPYVKLFRNDHVQSLTRMAE